MVQGSVRGLSVIFTGITFAVYNKKMCLLIGLHLESYIQERYIQGRVMLKMYVHSSCFYIPIEQCTLPRSKVHWPLLDEAVKYY